MDIVIAGSPNNLFGQKVTIPASGSASELITTQGLALVGIQMPAAWTAADIGYKACYDGNINNLVTVYSSGGAASTTVAVASIYIAFPTADVIFAPCIQLISVAAGGGSTTPAAQAAAREIILIFRRLFS